MLRKHAKVEHGEYREWSEDRGPVEPAIVTENEEYRKNLSYSIREENIKNNFSHVNNFRGIRIA